MFISTGSFSFGDSLFPPKYYVVKLEISLSGISDFLLKSIQHKPKDADEIM
jgi:hypothetical protein